MAIAEILDAWGEEGFEAHVRDMQREYCQRAATIQVTPPVLQCIPMPCRRLSSCLQSLQHVRTLE